MKTFNMLLLLMSFLLFTELSAEKQKDEQLLVSSEKQNCIDHLISSIKQRYQDFLAQKTKRGGEKSFVSNETGNLLLFGLSLGFLIYLPKHLSKLRGSFFGSEIDRANANFADYIIRKPHHWFFSHGSWSTHLYYELLTLLAGYICLKTGKPYWDKFKNV